MAVGSTNVRLDNLPHVSAVEAYIGTKGVLQVRLGDSLNDNEGERTLGTEIATVIMTEPHVMRYAALLLLEAADQIERTERSISARLR